MVSGFRTRDIVDLKGKSDAANQEKSDADPAVNRASHWESSGRASEEEELAIEMKE